MRPLLQGPYSVHMTAVRKCRGAKHTSCDGVQYSATMASPVALDFDILFQREVPPLEVCENFFTYLLPKNYYYDYPTSSAQRIYKNDTVRSVNRQWHDVLQHERTIFYDIYRSLVFIIHLFHTGEDCMEGWNIRGNTHDQNEICVPRYVFEANYGAHTTRWAMQSPRCKYLKLI